MTKLTKPVTRETSITKRDGGKVRPIVVTLHPGGLLVAQKGTRRRMGISYESLYDFAAKLLADAQRREKAARKRGSK